jgi:probable F420-dependent oxidoreductase
MRYGFYLPTRGQTATPEALETLVQRGESLGFASVMIADHLVFPVTIKSRYPYTVSGDFPGKGDVLDQLSLMTFVAAKTTRLRLVTSVMIVPYRNPVLTAKALATIDVLSKGRVTLGVGVGWMREEFEALGAPEFERRGAVTDEYIRIFKTLWTQSPRPSRASSIDSRRSIVGPSPFRSRTRRSGSAAHSKAALRRAARLGDGWHPVGANAAVPLPPSELRQLLDELYRLTEAEGRDPKSLTISYKAPVYDLSQRQLPGGERRPFSGGPAQIAEDIAAFARLGVSEIVFDFRSESLAESLERMESFGPVIRQG